MTTLATHPVDDPDQLALIADTWTLTKAEFAREFQFACKHDAETHGGWVDPSRVRVYLINQWTTDFAPRQFSALWSTATSRDGYLDNTDTWVQITGAGSKGNTNKSVRLRRWRGWTS